MADKFTDTSDGTGVTIQLPGGITYQASDKRTHAKEMAKHRAKARYRLATDQPNKKV